MFSAVIGVVITIIFIRAQVLLPLLISELQMRQTALKRMICTDGCFYYGGDERCRSMEENLKPESVIFHNKELHSSIWWKRFCSLREINKDTAEKVIPP